MRDFTVLRRALVALALLTALIATGCDRKPTLPRLANDAVVLAFGDSLTFGTGASERDSYPAALERLIGRRVVRAGIPGELSSAGLARLPEVMREVQPALVILIHGGNDLLQRQSEAAAARNIQAMAQIAKTRGASVVLLGVPKPGLRLAAPAYYAEIAKELGLVYDGETLAAILSDNALKSDLAHPNAAGFARLAEAVARMLTERKAIP